MPTTHGKRRGDAVQDRVDAMCRGPLRFVMGHIPSRSRLFVPLIALLVVGGCKSEEERKLDEVMSGLDKQFAAMAKTSEQALEKLEALVPGGSIDAETIAAIRAARTRTPPGRFDAICDDARALIESGRVAPGTKLTIWLPSGLGDNAPPPTGPAVAELLFVDSKSSRTVARMAPISKAHFGGKNNEIEAMIAWLQQDPDKRDLELVVVSGSAPGATFPPPAALTDSLAALTAAGLADRPLLHVDGKPMTVGEWVKLQ